MIVDIMLSEINSLLEIVLIRIQVIWNRIFFFKYFSYSVQFLINSFYLITIVVALDFGSYKNCAR